MKKISVGRVSVLGLGSEGLGVCVGKVPSQAKHSRQGSFFVSVAAWGMNHLRPNIPDRGLLLSVWLCGEGVISSQTCRTRVFFALYHLRPNIPDRGLLLYV